MPNFIEIFCGLGGLSQGFCQAGYELRLGLEIEKEQLETFTANHPTVPTICKDIRTVSPEEVSRVAGVPRGGLDILLGGPPCQGFSTYGRRDSSDPRNSLYAEYAKLIEFFSPSVIVLENVTGILSMDNGDVVRNILKLFKEDFGYTVTVMVLNAGNYGVPQHRRRVFFVGYKGDSKPSFPPPITYATRGPRPKPVQDVNLFLDGIAEGFAPCWTQASYDVQLNRLSASLPPAITVRDAISDLPREVFKPREINSKIAQYICEPQNAYQRAMRANSLGIHNHASKQHLMKRQARTLLLEQGAYGDEMHEKEQHFHKVVTAVKDLQSNTAMQSILRRARAQDVKSEEQFLASVQRLAESKDSNVAAHIEAGGFANKYRRLDWNSPSHTLVAHMARDCSDFIHPEENRPVSVREAARLQSFPDSFVFKSSQFRQFRGIGNSVPPLLAKAIALQIANDLERAL